MLPPYLHDAPTQALIEVRPRLLAVAGLVAGWLRGSVGGVHVRVGGRPGSGRSTLLHAIGAELGEHTVVPWQAATVPEGAPLLPALIGAMVQALPHAAVAAGALRLPLRLATDPAHHTRAQPAPYNPITQLGRALADQLGGRTLTVLVDDLEHQPRPAVDALLRALPLLAGAPVHLVATLDDSPLALKAFPHTVAPPPLEGAETVDLLRRWHHAEGTPFTGAHQDALDDAYRAMPAPTPRQIKTVLRRLHHLLHAEAQQAPRQLGADDAPLVNWLVAACTWPALPLAMRERDDRWWRDLRLTLENAMARRTDTLVDALLDAPGLPAWLVTHLPNPQQRPPASAAAFVAVLDGLRGSQARLDRWGL